MTLQNAFLAIALLAVSLPAHAQYTVEKKGSDVRGHLWVSEGPAGVFSANNSVGHRFRVGGELHFGSEYRILLGWTFYDRLFSGERSTSVGDISRAGTDFNFGYFIVPDRLWAAYTILLQDVSGSAQIGSVSTLGHQASVGYRFYNHGKFNLAVEGAWEFLESYDATTVNPSNNVTSTARFPPANVYSLNLRIGFDVGGL